MPILRPLVPQQGHLVAYPASNILIISDRAANIERLMKILREIDRQTVDEVEIVTLKHADAAITSRTDLSTGIAKDASLKLLQPVGCSFGSGHHLKINDIKEVIFDICL